MTTTIQSASVASDAAVPILVPAMHGRRAPGAIVAAGIAVAGTIIGVAIGQEWGVALGIPAAAVSGWLLAPRIRTDRSPIGVILAMAALTIAIADAMVVIGLGVASAIAGGGPFGELAVLELIGGAIVFWLLGLIIVGILSLTVTIPCAAVWALVVRRLARDGMGSPVPLKTDATR